MLPKNQLQMLRDEVIRELRPATASPDPSFNFLGATAYLYELPIVVISKLP